MQRVVPLANELLVLHSVAKNPNKELTLDPTRTYHRSLFLLPVLLCVIML
jgi:hypothetical protein